MKSLILFGLIVLISIWSTPAYSQIDIKGKLKEKIKNRAEDKVDQGIDSGLDAVENEGKEAVTKDDSDAEDSKDSETKQVGESDDSSAQQAQVNTIESYTRYDFVPGDKVLFFEDFSQDAIGDFPALWTTNGSGEVRTLKGYSGNWLYMNSQDNVYCLMKDLELPTNFILEFDVVPTPVEEGGSRSGFYMTLYNGAGEFLNDGLYPGDEGLHVACNYDAWNVSGYKQESSIIDGSTQLAPIDVNKKNHVIIWVQKRRLRIYHKGQKALDLPTVLYVNVKYNRLRFSLWGHEGFPYISNIRITSAAPDTRSKLLTEGKVVSYGIYFNVNSDQLQPESRGAIADIAKVMTENPDVKVKIVGHTDSDGADAANLDLSKRRAAAVKNEMVKTFAIGADRLITDGAGESQPVSSNSTSAGKAQNRRVEFIKL